MQTYCDATADALCEAYFACCQDPDQYGWVGGSLEGCKKKYRYGGPKCGYYEQEELEASIEAGNTVLNRANLDACVTTLKAMSAGGTACVEQAFSVFYGICLQALEGQIAPGEPCTGIYTVVWGGQECKHGQCFQGTCVPAPQLGEPCGITYATCEWPILCASVPTPYDPTVCIQKGEIDAPCADWVECKSDNCNAATGTCALPTAKNLCGGP